MPRPVDQRTWDEPCPSRTSPCASRFSIRLNIDGGPPSDARKAGPPLSLVSFNFAPLALSRR
ncbi:hypothetical protein BD410DRAFT_322533 [Rickenella mellea]|uniref:Uncharacterized protein n=1 Tax=Rickenella mellea TaxID=50990 RepID=A0A4Y7Q2E7_9AGAM|nr:hypothetical protein BD410DRAFT_322533 [Rickenella mellea]